MFYSHINETWHIKITQQDRRAWIFKSVLCVLQGWYSYIHYTSKLSLNLYGNTCHCIFKHLFLSSSLSDLVVLKLRSTSCLISAIWSPHLNLDYLHYHCTMIGIQSYCFSKAVDLQLRFVYVLNVVHRFICNDNDNNNWLSTDRGRFFNVS